MYIYIITYLQCPFRVLCSGQKRALRLYTLPIQNLKAFLQLDMDPKFPFQKFSPKLELCKCSVK